MKPTRPDKKIIKKKSMLLRDYFAGQALIGLMGKTNECKGNDNVVGCSEFISNVKNVKEIIEIAPELGVF